MSDVYWDAASHQELLDELTVFRSPAMIRQGMAEAAKGQVRDAVEAL
ncbi:MAG: hypothetical protein PUP93_20320 [Rhizonema sp. NSF051]|nr:hypothetical protein [Rhizonema sp. NSF051]